MQFACIKFAIQPLGPKILYTFKLHAYGHFNVIFSIYDFFTEGKKSKYRWFKVVGFGGGGLVGKKCNVSGVTKGFMC